MKSSQRKIMMTIPLCAVLAIPNIASAVAVSGQGTWETTLQGRDLDGNFGTVEAYYDIALNITWLANANYVGENWYGGTAPLYVINQWLPTANIYGVTGWRLPRIVDTGAPGKNVSNGGTDTGYNVQTTDGTTVYSEIASLYYNTLGNLAFVDTNGNYRSVYGLTNTGPFTGLQPVSYWAVSASNPTSASAAWVFSFWLGSQIDPLDSGSFSAMGVHDGDLGVAIPSSVPVPAAAWLFGSGLLGLVGAIRRKAV